MPTHWCNVGHHVGEGGVGTASATLSLVMAVEGASSKGVQGVSLVMAAFF